jgi:hypothetical protein
LFRNPKKEQPDGPIQDDLENVWNLGYKELEECSVEWRRITNNSEEGQGPQRADVSVMMMMMMMMMSTN